MVTANNTVKVWMKNIGLIAPTADKYVDGDYSNTRIHDSRIRSNIAMRGYYPQDLPNAPVSELNDMLKKVFTVLAPRIGKYPEAENAFTLFGADIMITAENIPKLIEINDLPVFQYRFDTANGCTAEEAETARKFDEDIFDSFLASVFTEVFYPAGDPKLITRLI